MRSYPIDTDRVRLISTGTVTAVPMWVVLADGSRKPDPQERQETNDEGLPLWKVEAITPADEGDDRDRTAVAEIFVGSTTKPDAGTFGDLLMFDGLVMTPGYIQKKTGQLTQPRWAAAGIRSGRGGGRKPHPGHEGEQAA